MSGGVAFSSGGVLSCPVRTSSKGSGKLSGTNGTGWLSGTKAVALPSGSLRPSDRLKMPDPSRLCQNWDWQRLVDVLGWQPNQRLFRQCDLRGRRRRFTVKGQRLVLPHRAGHHLSAGHFGKRRGRSRNRLDRRRKIRHARRRFPAQRLLLEGGGKGIASRCKQSPGVFLPFRSLKFGLFLAARNLAGRCTRRPEPGIMRNIFSSNSPPSLLFLALLSCHRGLRELFLCWNSDDELHRRPFLGAGFSYSLPVS